MARIRTQVIQHHTLSKKQILDLSQDAAIQMAQSEIKQTRISIEQDSKANSTEAILELKKAELYRLWIFTLGHR